MTMVIEASVISTGLNPGAEIDAIFREQNVGLVGWMIGTPRPDGTPRTFRDTLAQFGEAAVKARLPGLALGTERQVLLRCMQVTGVLPDIAERVLEIYDKAFPQDGQVK